MLQEIVTCDKNANLQMLELVCKVIWIIVKSANAEKFIQVLMESETEIQDDLENVIKVSLEAMDCEIEVEHSEVDNMSDFSARSSNLQKKPRTFNKTMPFDDEMSNKSGGDRRSNLNSSKRQDD
jgi:hypothetical protein